MPFYLLDMFGTAVFALSGVLLANQLKLEPFGVVVLAGVTAIGGGTIRDMALGATPVFWINDTNYLWVIFTTCLISMIALHLPRTMSPKLLPLADAIGLAVFVAIGVEKALRYSASPMVAVIMGVVTGCGGGIIRDLLVHELPMALRTKLYATSCVMGGVIHTVVLSIPINSTIATLAGISTTLVIRFAAIR
ncbi:hypothetical protein C9J01_28035 [Photobacterium rosenbergii]|uniref:Glycine transporter domain-containing protein n=1 Tax=Photobacterium rosenbergii TaxID=294936 RepID=A0A2T3MXS0_9GAMM|nr:TRIC cation channel family protein [Photobacterium rosenbergii]PSW04762.1 hypothetical protein C9J01_28035 [Photobacterium rosenbergii]